MLYNVKADNVLSTVI